MAVNKVLCFVESTEGRPVSVGFELLTAARELASDVAVFYVGKDDPSALAGEFGSYGAQKMYALNPGEYLPGAAAAAALEQLISSESIDVLLFPTSYTGRDTAGFLSARLGKPVISNGMSLRTDGDDVVVGTAIFGGQTLVDTAFRTGPPLLALIRPKSFEASEAGGGAAEVVPVDVPDVGVTGQAKVLENHVEKSEGPKLEEAAIVVSGGRGLGSAENYQLVENLAEALGAAKGASRAIVDAGWVPYSYQVGQTGKVVKPRVYIACGISGAMQHMVGMKDADHIIAVNKDSEAPIFSIASLGIIGDVNKVLPALTEAIKNKK
jgi:electron transfer flavoprotein alpha subunit